jgi:hypothetical protein
MTNRAITIGAQNSAFDGGKLNFTESYAETESTPGLIEYLTWCGGEFTGLNYSPRIASICDVITA